MPPGGKHKGQGLYAAVEKAFSEAWKKKHKHQKQRIGGYQAFKKSEEGQEIRAHTTRQYARDHGPFRNVGANTRSRLDEQSQQPQPDAEPQAGPSTAPDRAHDDNSINLFEFSGTDSTASDLGVNKYLGDFPSSLDFSPDMADIQNNLPNAPSASAVASGGGASAMDTDAQMEGGAGGSGAASGGGVASGVMTTIVPNPRVKSGHLTFHKVWYKYTYGLANTVISAQADSKVIRYSTPYAYYPVDWIPYYMSPHEYSNLPFDSRIVNVKATITPIGTRTAFDHGTTLSGTATTEYVPIVKSVVGLNTQLYIENRSVTLKPTEPMMVEGFKEKTLQDHFTAMYDLIGAIEVPRHLNWYANILYNTKSGNGFDGRDLQLQYHLDRVLTTHIINHKLGKPLIEYSYSPQNGYCKPTKRNFLISYNTGDGFPSDIKSNEFAWKKVLPTLLKLQNANDEKGIIGVSRVAGTSRTDFTNRMNHNYYQSVEGLPYIDLKSGSVGSYTPQPQVHIGLIATPALNPATEINNFLNSSLYTVVKTECVVSFDLDSMCVSGDGYCWPKDTKFFTKQDGGFYGYGYTNFGEHATTSGRVEGPPPKPKKHKSNSKVTKPQHSGRDTIKKSLIKDFSKIELDEYELHEPLSDNMYSD